MDPITPPPGPVPNPTTPHPLSVRTKRTEHRKISQNTFVPSPEPTGCTQFALQASLTNNVFFANERMVHAIFQPSKVDDQTVVGILAEINREKPLKAARDGVLSGTLAKRKKNKSMVSHRMLLS